MAEGRLERLTIFEGVEKGKLLRLEEAASELACQPGQVVYRTGDPCDGLYVVVRGAVLFRAERVGQPVERVRELGAGEVFGEKEVLAGTPRELTLRSVGESALLRIPVAPLAVLLGELPLFETALRTLAIRRRTAQVRESLKPSSRREPRVWVDRTVVLALAGGRRVHVRLEDLSPGGACLAGVAEPWKVGERLSFALGLDGGPDLLRLTAQVRWRLRGSLGLAFDASGAAHRKAVEQALRALTTSPQPLS